MFLLQDGPDLPRHIAMDDDGIAYANDVSFTDEPCPERFDGPARPDDPLGPPWSTLVFGLETGRDRLRDRFLAALREDSAARRPLVRYGDALESAFREIFGGRGATADAPSFLAFVREAVAQSPDAAVREQLARGDRELFVRPVDERIAQFGASAVSFATETGHWPADHPEVMYWLSALVPAWHVHFGQVVDLEEEAAESFGLEAWCSGKAIRSSVRNLGDHLDVWSCAGLVNVILRDVLRSEVRVFLQCEDEGALAVAGTRESLQELRSQGILASD
jgi:hypothetical protein